MRMKFARVGLVGGGGPGESSSKGKEQEERAFRNPQKSSSMMDLAGREDLAE
jgi:hypothetical protein